MNIILLVEKKGKRFISTWSANSDRSNAKVKVIIFIILLGFWADIKFYIYADFETRVERLYKQLKNMDIDEVEKELKLRDEIEINSGSFLRPVDAIEIDTTDKDINEVFEIMMKEIRKFI